MWDSAKEVGKKVRDRAIETGQKGLRLPGNRTRGISMATRYFTTKPKAQACPNETHNIPHIPTHPLLQSATKKTGHNIFYLFFYKKILLFIRVQQLHQTTTEYIFSQRTRTSHSRTYIIIKHISSLTFNSDFFVSKLETRI